MMSRRSRRWKQCQRSGRPLRLESLETRRLLAFNPTADEQHFMQLVNRFRTDPAGEFSRLISRVSPLKARDPVLQADLDFANVNGTVLRNELQALSPSQPVGWNEAVVEFTRAHNQAMIRQGVHFHSNSQQRFSALTGAGLQFAANGERILSENVFGYAKSVNHLFAAYVIDWTRGGPAGMASGRKHRVALHNPLFDQAGHALTRHNGSGNPPLGPQVSSQILVNLDQPPVMVTGAIFEDENASGWYEAGEGLSSVQFTFEDADGNRFETTGLKQGGYQIALPPGTYSATASGGGMRFPLRMQNIEVGTSNVWKNWIYDPNDIPEDVLEPNNSRASATLIEHDQVQSGLSIHSLRDSDYFRITPVASGSATFKITFANSAGNLDLELLDADKNLIAESRSNINAETIVQELDKGSTYYLHVFGREQATNGNYTLTAQLPKPAAPVATEDTAVFSGHVHPLVIDVLANDSNPDGSHSGLVPTLVAGTPDNFQVTDEGAVSYRPPEGFSGVQRARYAVKNEYDLASPPATLAVFVVDWERDLPWHNTRRSTDVNDDRSVTPIDALLVTNALNQASSGGLPTSTAAAEKVFGFVDTSGDGFLSPIDVLLVVQELNSAGSGEGELPSQLAQADAAATDQAFGQWARTAFFAEDIDKRRQKLRMLD